MLSLQDFLMRFTADATRHVHVFGSAPGASHQPSLVVLYQYPPVFRATLTFQQSQGGEDSEQADSVCGAVEVQDMV